MRRKIPKSSREEINRISSEKQEQILKYMQESGAVTIQMVAEALGLTHNNPNGYLYALYEKGKTQSYKAKAEKGSFKQAIRPEEIQVVKRTVKVGDPFYILDEEGNKKRIRVTDARYPYICLFDNGHAYSWANVALCKRPGIRILGQWGTTEGGSK